MGFTPILKFLKHFAVSSSSTLNAIFAAKQAAALDQKQREWDEKNPKPASSTMEIEGTKTLAKKAVPVDEDDEELEEDEEEVAPKKLRGGARTFQTARKSTGGKAPRKQLAQAAFGGNAFGGLIGDTRPVSLTYE